MWPTIEEFRALTLEGKLDIIYGLLHTKVKPFIEKYENGFLARFGRNKENA